MGRLTSHGLKIGVSSWLDCCLASCGAEDVTLTRQETRTFKHSSSIRGIRGLPGPYDDSPGKSLMAIDSAEPASPYPDPPTYTIDHVSSVDSLPLPRSPVVDDSSPDATPMLEREMPRTMSGILEDRKNAEESKPDAYGWNAKAFLKRLEAAQTVVGRAAQTKKLILRDVSEHNYQIRNEWQVPRTIGVGFEHVKGSLGKGAGPDKTRITFSTMTTGDAVEYFCRKGRHVVALNFANGKDVGGGYKNGASAQEEDLCRRCPSLYTSLYNAKTKDKLYPFGPCTAKSPTQPGRYTNVLWTPDLTRSRK